MKIGKRNINENKSGGSEKMNGEEILIETDTDLISLIATLILFMLIIKYIFLSFYTILIATILIFLLVEGLMSKIVVTSKKIYTKRILLRNKQIHLKEIIKMRTQKIIRTNGYKLKIELKSGKRINFPSTFGALSYNKVTEIMKIINKYK